MNGPRPTLGCDVPASELDEFFAGTVRGEARRRILEHLLAGCHRCRGHLSTVGGHDEPAERGGENPAATANALARLHAAAAFIDRERSEAETLIGPFLEHPVSRQWTLVRNARRFDTWSFAARLLDASYEALYDDARRTLELAEMAREIAGRLDPAPYGQRLVNDLVARALALCGNARRTLGDLRAAAQDLHSARKLLAEGTLDPLAEAELDYFEASWHVDAGDLQQALRTVHRSARVYRELGEEHLEGRSLNSEGHVLGLLGRDEDSLARFRLAAEKIDPDRDPHLALGVRHNLVWYLVEGGRLDEARRELAELELEFERTSHGSALAKLAWVRARIGLKSGARDLAEPTLREAMQQFADLELPFEAALVALDLCGLFAETGRWRELRLLAAETLSIFRALGVGPEAIATWLALQQAAEREAVTAALLGRLGEFFSTAAQRSPGRPAG